MTGFKNGFAGVESFTLEGIVIRGKPVLARVVGISPS